MKISVVIPVRNMAATVKRAIDSALPQADEVIVVDDGSTDNTPALLDSLMLDYRKMKRITHDRNRGVVAARNTAISLPDTDWIIPLDADDYLTENIIPILRVSVDSRTFAYGDWLEDEGGEFPVMKSAAPIEMIDRKNVAKATFLFSRTMWDAVAGYDAAFESIGAEDWAFMAALLEAGFKGVRIEMPIYHYQSATDGRAALARQHEAEILALMRTKYPRTMRVNPVIAESAHRKER